MARFDVSPDQISYWNIARLYLAGNWGEAINGFWSPLLSWLMVPALTAGATAWLAGKLVCVCAGLAAVYFFGQLSRWFTPARMPLVQCLAAVFTATIAVRTTADLLAAALLLFYWSEVWSGEWKQRAWKIGLAGGLLYLSKNYLLFFFCLHLPLMAAIDLWQRRDTARNILSGAAVALAVALAISGCWMAVLSQKYGRFTASRAGVVNLGMVGPESSGYRQHKILVPPSSPHAYSMLQDPPPEVLPAWTPASPTGIKQLLRLARKNLQWLGAIYHELTVFWLVLVVLFILAAASGPLAQPHWFGPVATLVLLPVGYLFVIVVDRYLWSINYLLLLMGASAYQRIATYWPVSQTMLRAAAGLIIASFLWNDLTNVRDTNGGAGRLEWQAATQLRPRIQPESRTVSCGAYESSLIISYYLGARYHGLVREGPEDRQYARELNPAYDQSSASRLPPAPPDAAARLDRLAPDWLLLWPSCPSLPDEVTQRLDPNPIAVGPGGVKLHHFRRR